MGASITLERKKEIATDSRNTRESPGNDARIGTRAGSVGRYVYLSDGHRTSDDPFDARHFSLGEDGETTEKLMQDFKRGNVRGVPYRLSFVEAAPGFLVRVHNYFLAGLMQPHGSE